MFHGLRVSVQHITKRFANANRDALSDVTVTVEPGSLFALLGASGSGKTTLLRIISGFERPDRGTVRIGDRIVCGDGIEIAPESRGVGFVFQQASLFPHITVKRNILFGMRGFPGPTQAHALAAVTELCALKHLLDRYPHELSGGEQQRAALARALARGNGVVLLDEPMSSVDASMRADMSAQLRRILRDSGTTAILVTHDQAEAMAFADVVGVMREGHLEQVDTPQRVYASPANMAIGSFIGAANFLPATIVDGRLRTEVCDFDVGAIDRSSVSCRAMVRPNELTVTRDGVAPAVVDEVRFTGATYLYSVRLASGQLIRCEVPAPGHSPIEPGAPVRLAPLISEPLIFPATDEAPI